MTTTTANNTRVILATIRNYTYNVREDGVHFRDAVVVRGDTILARFPITWSFDINGDWGWAGENNWSVTEANAELVGVGPKVLVSLITVAVDELAVRMRDGAYVLYELGPDNFSTWPECFAPRCGLGREQARAGALAGLRSAVAAMRHDNITVRGPTNRIVALTRADYRDLLNDLLAAQAA